jgi:hypothetical protein
VKPIDLDPSLAFTALLELDPGMRERSGEEGAIVRRHLLADYYAQDAIRNLFDYTRWWISVVGEPSAEPGPPQRMIGEYVGRLRRIAELKAQVRQLETAALEVANMLQRRGATHDDLCRYEAVARGDKS